MSPLLPDVSGEDHYWQTIYPQPLSSWQPALEVIRARHHLPGGTWERSALGRNVVFTGGPLVVKLSPPFWSDEIPREAEALQFVHRRLPAATPELVATGELDHWRYLVQTRLPGELLRSLWPTLKPDEKARLTRQHGELMAALHTLPLQNAPASLAFDWPQMLNWQLADCAQAMRTAGVATSLVDDLPAYLEQAQPLLAVDNGWVLLHGDLDAINLLVEYQHNRWRITGLVDWGDVKIGPIAHEFISPRIHMYRQEAGPLLSWYEGYGLGSDQRTPQFAQNLMARTMLYYAGEFAFFLSQIPGASRCRRWTEVAACLWRMTA
jgi:hygromycin-B 7''-O-kinase